MSFSHSSRIVAPILHWLFPNLAETAVHGVVFAVRKAAHVTEYTILGMLAWRALRKPMLVDLELWHWPQAGIALLMVALYASSDEFHQSFVPSRQASVWDVLLDTTGGALGLLFLWILGRWRKRWS